MRSKLYFFSAVILGIGAAYMLVSLTFEDQTRVIDTLGHDPRLLHAGQRQMFTPLVNTKSNSTIVPVPQNSTFTEALKVRVGKDNLIVLSSVDTAYLPMAVNLYYSSLKRLGIHNYLFACSDTNAYNLLTKEGIAAYDYLHDKDGGKPSAYGSAAFRRKTHMKTKIILEALLLGMTVLIIDVDIVLFKNPIPFLDCFDCDIQIQSDISEGNSGFYLVRPTRAAIELHEKAWQIGNSPQGEKTSNQKALDRNMEKMQKAGKIKVKTISKQLFPPGLTYFEEGRRMFFFDNPPDKQVLVHNNWIVSKAAKIYRFKEFLLWMVDKDGYYTDPNRKYFTYDNLLDLGDQWTINIETETLKMALAIGYILNRTLILPTFSCIKCKYGACKPQHKRCSFNTHYKIASFDAQFENQYREHSFLSNPLVPEGVKVQGSKYMIHNDKYINKFGDVGNFTVLMPKDKQKGASIDEIKRWFGEKSEPVLHFHSLYGSFADMDHIDQDYRDRIGKALNTKTDYRQY